MNDFELTTKESCPRCGNLKMKSWHQLNDDEREIVKRLPASSTYKLEERKTLHLWCARCWFEINEPRAYDA
jgi:hypothetical protein